MAGSSTDAATAGTGPGTPDRTYGVWMIRHILLVSLADEPAAAARLQDAFERIGRVAGRLPGVLSCSYGPSKSPEQLERGYTHGLVIDFADASALRGYAVDPEHVAAGGQIAGAATGGVDGLLVVDLQIGTADTTA